MIQIGTKLKVVDNSGAKWVKCINILGKGNKKYARVGSIVLITISRFSSRKKVNKRKIYLGLVVGVAAWVFRKDGTHIKFFSNRLLVINKQYKFLGTRIYGAVLKEIRQLTAVNKKDRKIFQKIISYSSVIL